MVRVCAAGAFLFSLLVFGGCGSSPQFSAEPAPARGASLLGTGLSGTVQQVGETLPAGKWYCDED